MNARRIAVIALSGALVAGGAGAAVAAVTKDDDKKAEQAVLDDAAKRLNVAPEKLREALAAAQDAQLDQAVKNGDLTQRQADAIKAARKESGRVLGGPLGMRTFRGGPGVRMFGSKRGLFGDLADALGTTPAKLMEQLRAGKSLGDVAKANGKSLDEVRSALKATAKTRLDKAVKDGDLTQKQADAILAHVDEELKEIGSRRMLMPRIHGHRFGGKGPEMRPGGLMPGEALPYRTFN